MNRQRSNPPTPMMMYSRGTPQQAGARIWDMEQVDSRLLEHGMSKDFMDSNPQIRVDMEVIMLYAFNEVFVKNTLKE